MSEADTDLDFGPVIPWEGGVCPLDADTVVRFHYRDGRSGVGMAIQNAFRTPALGKYQGLIWQHAPLPHRSKPANDIIAYQVANG